MEWSAYARRRSAFTIRGFAAGHDRRHDEHVQKPITVAPVITCSCFTNAVSLQPGHAGIVEADNRVEDARVMRARSINIFGCEELRRQYTACGMLPNHV